MNFQIAISFPPTATYGDLASLELEIADTNIIDLAVRLLLPEIDEENPPEEAPMPQPVVSANVTINPSNARAFFESTRASLLALTMLGMDGTEVDLPVPPPEVCEAFNEMATHIMNLYEERVKPMEKEIARIRAEVEAGNLDPYQELSEREAKIIAEGCSAFHEEKVIIAIAVSAPLKIMMEKDSQPTAA